MDRNIRVRESGLHSASLSVLPRQAMSSQIDVRCWSGGILSRTTLPLSTLTITRWIIVMLVSPGSGYFHACSVGWPTLVTTRYMSPVLRWSCWYVANSFESGDQSPMAWSLCFQPALSVA